MQNFAVLARLSALAAALLLLGPVATPDAVAQEATPAPAAEEAARAATDVRYVVPFTPDGLNPALAAIATEAGACGFPSSMALGRPDAWECAGPDNRRYDPCFENPYLPPDEPGAVACFASPYDTDVVLLELDAPLPREKDGDGPGSEVDIAPWALPWALDLANGDRCTLLRGTLSVVAGQVAHYGCEAGGTILGETDRSLPLWRVSYLAAGDVASSLVGVRTAWS